MTGTDFPTLPLESALQSFTQAVLPSILYPPHQWYSSLTKVSMLVKAITKVGGERRGSILGDNFYSSTSFHFCDKIFQNANQTQKAAWSCQFCMIFSTCNLTPDTIKTMLKMLVVIKMIIS